MASTGMAFAQVGDGELGLCLGPGEPVFTTGWVFPFVSAVRWCADQGRVLVTATPAGGRPPSMRANDRGELALLAWRPGEDRWQRLYRGYAHDPVCLSGGGYAVHRGAGLTFLDAAGRKTRELKAGRFSWGPPSLSVRPSGDLVAWIRWRGDARRLFLQDATGMASKDLRTSVYQYAWMDDDTIVYYLHAGLRLLDIHSGRSRRLAADVATLIGTADLPDRAARYLPLHIGTPDVFFTDVDGLQVVAGQLWFTMSLGALDNRYPSYTGLFARSADGRTRLVTDVAPQESIESFAGLPDGSALLTVARHQGTRITRREQRPAGPLAPFLAQGWRPLPGSGDPEFGFHALP
jgi:hypothetical protein